MIQLFVIGSIAAGCAYLHMAELPALAQRASVGFQWNLPVWMSEPVVPPGNSMSLVKVELGRHLFFDIRLSGPGYMSCATCHKPELGFTDGRKVAIGVTGDLHTRNTPTLANVAFMNRLGWAEPSPQALEVQLRRPMFSEEPIEMGTRGHEVPVLLHLRSNSVYRQLFREAFPGRHGDITFETVGLAIAAFQRTIVSGNAAYDRYASGDLSALSEAAKRGLDLFRSTRLKCAKCHVPPFFTDATGAFAKFHNTGLYNVDGNGRLPGPDQGLYNITASGKDVGRFRTPTLRNIAVTAPYMHDGSIASLNDVIAHYAAGGRAAIGGRPSPKRSPMLQGFTLSSIERRDLLAFLESLTDSTFLTEPRYRTPFR